MRGTCTTTYFKHIQCQCIYITCNACESRARAGIFANREQQITLFGWVSYVISQMGSKIRVTVATVTEYHLNAHVSGNQRSCFSLILSIPLELHSFTITIATFVAIICCFVMRHHVCIFYGLYAMCIFCMPNGEIFTNVKPHMVFFC